MTGGADERIDIEREALELLEEVRTLMLATVDAEGGPEASYAPFVHRDGAFHVFVSGLARHTANLVERPRAGVLLIRDEERTRQLYARARLSFDCDVFEIARSSAEAHEVLEGFETRFGSVMSLIRPLPDFRLLRLAPRHGTYVRGFGQAYTFRGGTPAGLSHVDEATIRRRE